MRRFLWISRDCNIQRTGTTRRTSPLSKPVSPRCGQTCSYSYGFVLHSVSGGKLRIFAGDSSWDFIPVTSNVGTIVADTWTHRAFCKSGSTIYAFQDGVLVSTIETSGAITMMPTVMIGVRTVSASGFVGYIDEVRVSNIARWTSNFTPPTEPYSEDKQPNNIYAKLGGIWVEASSLYVKQNGTW